MIAGGSDGTSLANEALRGSQGAVSWEVGSLKQVWRVAASWELLYDQTGKAGTCPKNRDRFSLRYQRSEPASANEAFCSRS